MYTLIDGVKRNQENPRTFEIPTKEEIANLKIDDYVKLGFVEGESVERMWVKIISKKENDFIGTLENDPFSLETIKFKHIVVFSAQNILSTT